MMTDTVVDAGVVSPPLEPFGILRAVRAVLGGVSGSGWVLAQWVHCSRVRVGVRRVCVCERL